MTITLYGIANCDNVRRARAWLDARGLAYRLHDYKRAGIEAERLARWAATVGPDALLNRRGTTWRKLPEEERARADAGEVLAMMAAHPSLIRRPVAEVDGGVLIGFDPAAWAERLG